MKKIIFLITCLFLLSCEKEEETETYYARVTYIDFSVKNSIGEDLLDPAHPDHLEKDDIKLFYLIDGKKVEVFDSNLNHPRHFIIYKHENEYRITIFPNHSDAEEKAITYVQWNETDVDTLAVTFERTINSIIRKEVWLNEVLVYDRADDPNSDPFIHITK